ncbi:MAG: ATP12 family protein [Albidovulum sp.]
MSSWKAKRFWQSVTVTQSAEGFELILDDRPLHTPGKRRFSLPTKALADAVASEWRAVDKTVDPGLMPVTRAANSAIDKVAPQFREVADMIAAYGASDLLCYRADAPTELVAGQAEAWDPWLDWVAHRYDARLVVTTGIVPIAQPELGLRNLAARVHACTAFELTALHDLVSISGSLVLGLAATEPDFDPEMLWQVSRFDEEWQTRLWGVDDEASVITEKKRLDFLSAHNFWELVQVPLT